MYTINVIKQDIAKSVTNFFPGIVCLQHVCHNYEAFTYMCVITLIRNVHAKTKQNKSRNLHGTF